MQDPIYRQAYPRFDILKAKLSNPSSMNIEHNRRLCLFKTLGGFAGSMVVLARTEQTIVVDYFMRGAEYRYGDGQICLQLVDAPNGVDGKRQYFRCDGCERGRQILAFRRETWMCCDCHRLGYRSKLIDPQVRMWEELDEIDKQIPGGRRRKGMRDQKFSRLRQRQAELRAQLGPYREVSEAHRQIIRANWLRVADVDHIDNPRYEKKGDIFVPAVPPSWEVDQPTPAPLPVATKPVPEASPNDISLGPVGESYWIRGYE